MVYGGIMESLNMFSFNSNKLFIFVLYCSVFLSYVLSGPIPDSPYTKFIQYLIDEKCTMPKELKHPFPETSDSPPFSYLYTPLSECQTPDAGKEFDEANVLCTEIFDVLKNITCVKYNQSLPIIKNDHLSENVCHDFGNLKDILPKKDNYLSGRLTDSLTCKFLCSAEKYEELCKTLYWSYDSLLKIKSALHIEEQVQANESENTVKVLSDEAISSVKPAITSDLSEPKSQKMKEPNSEVVESMKPEKEPESNLNQTGEDSKNPKVSSEVVATSSQDISSKKSSSDPLVQDEDLNKTAVTNNVSNSILPAKSESGNLSPEALDESVKPTEIKNLPNVKPQPEPSDNNENKIDEKLPQKNVNDDDDNPQANVDEKSLTSNVNVINNNQNIKTVSGDNLLSDGNDSVSLKQNITENNIGSKTSEKSTDPVIPATDNELKSNNFPEEDDKPKTKETDLQNEEEKDTEKENPKKTNYEGPNEILPDKDLKLPEPPTQPALPDEDIEHQEDKDQDQYNDIENESEYAKPEYDNSFNVQSKNKESEIKNSIVTGSNQLLNGYAGSNISPKDNIGQISEEIAMIAPFPEQEDSHFFFYFLSIVLIIMAGYLIFHNKQKIIALIVEGRHERRRRSYAAGYKKLETK